MAFPVASFAQLMSLEPHGTDVFVGVGPEYPWGRVYGGQVAAQALRAAMHTTEPEYMAHSLHAYFIRGGDSDEPIRYEVDRIRNGRSFCTRRVVARQSGGAILNLSASFQLHEDQADVQTATLPDVPAPQDCEPDDWGTLLERRQVPPDPDYPGSLRVWLRVGDPIAAADEASDPATVAAMHVCAHAYASDDIPTGAAVIHHPRRPADDENWEDFVSASLDHAVWFHRPRPANQWMLHDFNGEGLQGGRGLAMGRIFAEDGTHVASIAQEVLFRERNR